MRMQTFIKVYLIIDSKLLNLGKNLEIVFTSKRESIVK